jgi:hypothetical protein
MPIWMVAPSGMRSAISSPMTRSPGRASTRGTSTSGRSDVHHPATCEWWMVLAPWVRGMCGVASRKNGTRPISRAT